MGEGDSHSHTMQPLIDESQLISLRASNKTVREILHELFHDSFELQEKGNHLILRRKLGQKA